MNYGFKSELLTTDIASIRSACNNGRNALKAYESSAASLGDKLIADTGGSTPSRYGGKIGLIASSNVSSIDGQIGVLLGMINTVSKYRLLKRDYDILKSDYDDACTKKHAAQNRLYLTVQKFENNKMSYETVFNAAAQSEIDAQQAIIDDCLTKGREIIAEVREIEGLML